MPAILALIGGSLLLFALGNGTQQSAFITAAFALGACAGVFHFSLLVMDRHRYWSISALLGAATLASYCGTGALSLLFLHSYSGIVANIYHKLTPLQLTQAGLYILLFYAAMCLSGRLERRSWKPILKATENENLKPGPYLVFAVILTMSQLRFMLSGEWSYGGLMLSDADQLPVDVALVMQLGLPSAGVLGWILGKKCSWPTTLLCLAILAIGLLWHLGIGRRAIILQLMLVSVGFLWARYHVVQPRRMLVFGAVAVFLALSLSMLFYSMRLDAIRGDGGDGGLLQRVESAFSDLSSDAGSVAQAQKDDVAVRSFMLVGHLANLMEGTGIDSATGGLLAFYHAVLVVPRLLLPTKMELLPAAGVSEAWTNPRFDVPVIDQPDSIIASSYIDFLWAGLFIYPMFILGIAVGMVWVLNLVGNNWARIYLLFAIFITFADVEQPLFGYFTNLRNMLVIAGLAIIVRLCLGRPLQAPSGASGGPGVRPAPERW